MSSVACELVEILDQRSDQKELMPVRKLSNFCLESCLDSATVFICLDPLGSVRLLLELADRFSYFKN